MAGKDDKRGKATGTDGPQEQREAGDKAGQHRFLDAVRREIDWVDEEILELLNRRARISKRVGRLKAGSGDPVFKPYREKLLLERLTSRNLGPLPNEHLRAIYREIMSSSRSLQRPQRIVYLGPEGTFSYFAAVEFMGRSVEFSAKADIEGVFAAVSAGEAELGVIPLENSLQGSVGQSLDLFYDYSVFIQAEMYCRIAHCLLARGENLSDIREIHSHPQALAQCAGWLRSNLPSAAVIPTESTAAAARIASEKEGAAAIGHRQLAALNDLRILSVNISDQPENWTRFCVISSAPLRDGTPEKTSILFTTLDKPGALASILQVLASADINLSKLESRPLRGEKWKYVFFADLQCDLYRDEYVKVLQELKSHCHTLRLLGSYPSGPHLDMSRD